MLNLLNVDFGFAEGPNGTPALYLFGFPIYVYALIIVTGMCMAILVAASYFKKRGYDPYDMITYAMIIIPIGILGARLYVYVFPWAGKAVDWSTFFNFRRGGLGIYGGVILGYIAAYVVAKIKKQRFSIIADCIMPGLFLAQSIGRWGNFVNQEAHGPSITNPAWQWFPFGVEISGDWFYATFFYESMATLLGFIICILLARSKKYKLGWLTAFYGIYYGILRLLIEGMRTDSLFLWIGSTQTDIKISQLVSVVTIILGLYTLAKIYRASLRQWYSSLFADKRQEMRRSRFVVLAVAILSAVVAVTLFALGGESKFIIAVALSLLTVYSIISIFAINDKLKLFDGDNACPTEYQPSPNDNNILASVRAVYAMVVVSMLFALSIVLLVMSIAVTHVPNQIVLAVLCLGCCVPLVLYIYKTYRLLNGEVLLACNGRIQLQDLQGRHGTGSNVRLSKWLLAIFPFRQDINYGVENIKPYVDILAQESKKKK